MLRIGLLSDTHGLLRPQAERFLAGCDHIVHAGDIGCEDILVRLAALAPVTAVRGNNDTAGWGAALPDTQLLRLGAATLYVLHDLKDLRRWPAPDGVQAIVCGHSHKPQAVQDAQGRLVLNPGSAGPRRFRLPVSAGELLVRQDGTLAHRLVDLLAA